MSSSNFNFVWKSVLAHLYKRHMYNRTFVQPDICTTDSCTTGHLYNALLHNRHLYTRELVKVAWTPPACTTNIFYTSCVLQMSHGTTVFSSILDCTNVRLYKSLFFICQIVQLSVVQMTAVHLSYNHENDIFTYKGKIFCVKFQGNFWNFTQNILPIDWKMYISFRCQNLILRARRCFPNNCLVAVIHVLWTHLPDPNSSMMWKLEALDIAPI